MKEAGGEECPRASRAMIASGSHFVREQVRRALVLFRELDCGGEEQDGNLRQILERLAMRVPSLTMALCELMLDQREDNDDRRAAICALRARPDEAAIPYLLGAIDEFGREPGLALVSYGPAAADHALRWLDSTVVKRKVAAILAFLYIRDARSVPWLLALIDDSHADVRRACCWALANQRCPRGVAPLLRVLRSDQDVRNRCAAAEGLGHLGDSRAAPALSDAMHGDLHPAVHRSAVCGLECLPGAAVDRLLADGPLSLAIRIDVTLSWRAEYPEVVGLHPHDMPDHEEDSVPLPMFSSPPPLP